MKFMVHVASALVLLSVSSSALAFTWGSRTRITGYYIYAGGTAFMKTDNNENPDGCSSGSHYLALDSSAQNFKYMWSQIVAAEASGSTVTINYDGCFNGYPRVNAIATPEVW